MKARTVVTICLLAGATAWAQNTPPSQQVVPDKKPQAQSTKPALSGAPAKPAAKPATAAKPTAAAVAKPAPKAAAQAAQAHPTKTALGGAPATKKPQAQPAKTAVGGAPGAKPTPKKRAPATKAMLKTPAPAAKKEAPKTSTANKRDPFVSPIREAGVAGPTCTSGKKCLAIDTVDLKGIVVSQVGMIAVVESSVRKVTYFLRENDPVFNGYVVKITPDSIVFRENVVDRMGKQSTRDVVKRVVAPAV